MHKILAVLSAMAAFFGTVLIVMMLYGHFTGGFSGAAGMSILVFQLFGFLFSVIGLGLALISRLLAHRKEQTPLTVTAIAIGLSVFSLLALFLGLTFG